jgi:hypothetical protein
MAMIVGPVLFPGSSIELLSPPTPLITREKPQIFSIGWQRHLELCQLLKVPIWVRRGCGHALIMVVSVEVHFMVMVLSISL